MPVDLAYLVRAGRLPENPVVQSRDPSRGEEYGLLATANANRPRRQLTSWREHQWRSRNEAGSPVRQNAEGKDSREEAVQVEHVMRSPGDHLPQRRGAGISRCEIHDVREPDFLPRAGPDVRILRVRQPVAVAGDDTKVQLA